MEHPAKTLNSLNAVDPVCGMDISARSSHRYVFEGIEYGFCSEHCEKQFAADPSRYVRGHALDQRAERGDGHVHKEYCHACHAEYADEERLVAGAIYTCPMYPEIRQRGPGSCPRCGMTLEPLSESVPTTPTAYTCPMHPEIVQDEPGNCPKCGMAMEPRRVTVEERNEALIDMTRRFWVSCALALLVFVLAMVADLVPSLLPAGLSLKAVQWTEFVLATPVVIWGGWPFFVRGVQSVISWNLNMFTLIGLGVLIKNAEALEVMEKVDTIVVDKTGTLTEGKPRLVAMQAGSGFTEEEVLQLAASLERASEHPLAEAIVRGAQDRGVSLSQTDEFESFTGQGVTGTIQGRAVALGNLTLLEKLGIDPGELPSRAQAGRAEGQTVMFVAVDGRAAGIVGVADPIKDSTPKAIRDLHAEGVQVVMLTGDSRTTATAVARRLGIDRVEAEVLPDRKAEFVKQLQAEGSIVAMAGDGINDAPALAQRRQQGR